MFRPSAENEDHCTNCRFALAYHCDCEHECHCPRDACPLRDDAEVRGALVEVLAEMNEWLGDENRCDTDTQIAAFLGEEALPQWADRLRTAFHNVPTDRPSRGGHRRDPHEGARMRFRGVVLALTLWGVLFWLLRSAFAAETTSTRELSLFLGTAPAVVHDFGPGLRYYAIDTLTGRFDAEPQSLHVTARAVTFQAPGVDIACLIDATTYRQAERLHDVLTTQPPGERATREVVTWQTKTLAFQSCELTRTIGSGQSFLSRTEHMAGRYFGARATTTGETP